MLDTTEPCLVWSFPLWPWVSSSASLTYRSVPGRGVMGAGPVQVTVKTSEVAGRPALSQRPPPVPQAQKTETLVPKSPKF